MELTAQSYYDETIKVLTDCGLKFLAQVQISTKDFPYFVSAAAARATSLVFYVEGLACIVRLSHNEHIYEDGKGDDHWNLALDAEFKSHGAVEKCTMLPTMHKEPPLYVESDPWGDEPGRPIYALEPQIKGFHHCGWSARAQLHYRWNADAHTNDGSAETRQLMTALVDSIELLKPFLKVGAFTEMNPDFPPTYVFGGGYSSQQYKACQSLYWERFGAARRQLAKLINKIY